MSEIAGATITYTDYTGSPSDPRLLNVPDASGDVTVQDVLDTLSARQADLDALIYDPLLDIPDTSGKQQLSATKLVGITCVMIRVNVKFEDLPGPTWTIKRVADGNLAAIDDETARNLIEPMASSAYVNWKTEADVSAALLNPVVVLDPAVTTIIATTQYLGAIWIDAANGSAGTVAGTNGTPQKPVDTLADALTLATAIGFRQLVLVSGNLTLTTSLTEFCVELRDESEINFGAQNINGSEFHGGVLKGSMTGSIQIEDSSLEDVTGLLGHVRGCGINGTITLGVGMTTFDRCHSHVPGTSAPTLNFNGSGTKANVRAYSGGLRIESMTDASNVATVEFVAGQVVVDADCTAGELVLRGITKITDNSTGTVVDTSGVVGSLVWDASLSSHTAGGSTGEALEDALAAAKLAAALAASQ